MHSGSGLAAQQRHYTRGLRVLWSVDGLLSVASARYPTTPRGLVVALTVLLRGASRSFAGAARA